MKNWSGNLQWNPLELLSPKTEAEISEIVNNAVKNNKKIRVIGSGHSFSPICLTKDVLISLDNFQGLINVNPSNLQVTVKAGTKLNVLNKLLTAQGLAMENMGDVDLQSIAGAISTGTHGTGTNYGNISTQVRRLTFINGYGALITCALDENPLVFKAAVLSLGTLGIITQITLQCVPAFNLELVVKKSKLNTVLNNLENYNLQNNHFEFYWFPNTSTVMTKVANRTSKKAQKNAFKEYFQEVVFENQALKAICECSYRLPSLTNKISRLAANTVSEFKKVKNSHQVFSTERRVLFNEMEYNVPIEAYKEVKKEIVKWINKNNSTILFPIESRFVKGDALYLSPAYKRDSAYIAVHAYHKKEYHNYFSALETIFKAYGGRPHWGKIHTQTSQNLEKLYPEFETFKTIRAQQDPKGLFLSPHMKTIFGKSNILVK